MLPRSKPDVILVEYALLDNVAAKSNGIYRSNVRNICALLKATCFYVGIELERALTPDEQHRFKDLVLNSSNLLLATNHYLHPANNFIHGMACIPLAGATLTNSIQATLAVISHCNAAGVC